MKHLSKVLNESVAITWSPSDVSDISDLEDALMEIIEYAARYGRTYEGSHECLTALMSYFEYGAEDWLSRLE